MRIIKEEKIPIKMWLDEIEPKADRQVRNLANLSGAFHHIAIMPDAHVGYGMPIGGVLATIDTIVPNAVGVDIGCGMVAAKTSIREIDRFSLKQILTKLKKVIPTGFAHHKQNQTWEGFSLAPNIPIIQQELNSARKQIGTLGGGNHFIEVLQEIDNNNWSIKGEKNIWLMLHSGSRNFGLKVANMYHKKAYQYCEANNIKLPDRDLAFLPIQSREGREYWEAMNYCQDFAQANRALMMERFMEIVQNVTKCDFINCIKEFQDNAADTNFRHLAPNKTSNARPFIWIHHNYAAREEHFGKNVIVHRKGATRALKGQLGIVPGSMGTPSYIIKGLGNPESFMSCAHGAGRTLGRREANRKLTKEEVDQAISGIVFEGWRDKLDEAPQAYKNIEAVIRSQIDLARPVVKLKPLAVMIGN